MNDERPPVADTALYEDIIYGRRPPDPVLRQAGWDAHAAGTPFGSGPRPIHSVEALCWRIGWNDRALENRA